MITLSSEEYEHLIKIVVEFEAGVFNAELVAHQIKDLHGKEISANIIMKLHDLFINVLSKKNCDLIDQVQSYTDEKKASLKRGAKQVFEKGIMFTVIPPNPYNVVIYVYIDVHEKPSCYLITEDDLKKGWKEKFDIQYAVHAARNILNTGKELPPQLTLDFNRNNGYNPNVNRVGISLGEIEYRLMEGILKGLTKHNYNTGINTPVEDILKANKIQQKGASYREFKTLPTLNVTQCDLFKLAGIYHGREEERAIKAIEWFQETQFCFYYKRARKDEKGNFIVDKKGQIEKEDIYTIDRLFTIKEVRKEGTEVLDYYEITPSVIFLDQREEYFLMFPSTWRDEVRLKLGKKKVSQYTFEFLIFLRWQFEEKRRAKVKKYEITNYGWKALAEAINLPESMFIKKKGKVIKILQDAFFAAQSLGYTKECKFIDEKVFIKMDERKYYNPEDETPKISTQ